MQRSVVGAAAALVAVIGMGFAVTRPSVQERKSDEPRIAELRSHSEKFAKAFDAGKAEEMAALFLAQGELVDENGLQVQGRGELTTLFKLFFEKFPGATITMAIESARFLAPNLAIEEGTRIVVTKDGKARARVRFSATLSKENGEWRFATVRDFDDPSEETPHDHLKTLEWLVGNWVAEAGDGSVKVSYRWTEDKNFLLGEYTSISQGKIALKTSLRIGWDPLAQRVRAWFFDSDGGYADATFIPVDDSWIIKTSSVMPDGTTGSATLRLSRDAHQIIVRGSDRLSGTSREPDFELKLARQPPAPGK